jgi:RNA polymerase sigma-70 factor (ECF subfamily)
MRCDDAPGASTGGLPERPAIDPRDVAVHTLISAGSLAEAASLAIAEHGPELLRFLHVRLRSKQRAEEAYSLVCEDLWLGLPKFAWRSSLRTWLFVLARSAASRLSRAGRRERAVVSEAEHDYLEQCDRVRTTTALYQQTETKRRMRALREQLDDDQQTLLILRVDRALSWRELAIVMGEVAAEAAEEEHVRASSRVRTRFQTAKRRLRELALDAGLISMDGD